MSLNRWTLYVVLKHFFFFFWQFTTGHLCYWLLNSGNGDMVKGNKQSSFFRVFDISTGSFSACSALLKLRSKDSIKQKHFGICHLYGMTFCFEIDNTMTYLAYFSLFSFFFVVRVLCRRWALKNELCMFS